ncbi:MAG TPA: 6-pyruvoyl-tetrahydropterin synthase-related protein, partial [Anaerolineae bacterium]|nr:6-pyruvoyl-tetrahydropterin synthase-related protein [Anaerolineae bacterium]
RGTDAELHVYRAAQLGQSVRAGALYPRWAPDLYFGYGYPIFNYYAPLTYYLSNLFGLLPGVDIVGGVKAVFVLGLCAAALGACLLGRELFGPAAGVVAAASFTFAPYVVFIDPHARGDLPEHLAICLLPLAFYAFRRLMSGKGGRGALAGSALALAALVFSHNLLGLVASGLLLGYWAWEVVVGTGRPRAGWGALVFVLAAAIIAFFWLPALLERGAVELNVVGPGHFDFHEHFLSLGELLAPSRISDLGATAPRYRFNLGLAQWLLALPAVGAVALFRRRFPPSSQGGVEGGRTLPSPRPSLWEGEGEEPSPRPSPWEGEGAVSPPSEGGVEGGRTLPSPRPSPWEGEGAVSPPSEGGVGGGWRVLPYFILAGLGLGFLMLPASTSVWEHVPWMAYLQFPWRLLGAANLMLAVCAAGSVTLLSTWRWRNPVLAATLGAILVLALPVLYPPAWPPEFGGTGPQDIIEWEQHSLALGTTSTGDFLPVGAARGPIHPEPTLLASYTGPGPVDKVNRATLRDGTSVQVVEHGPLHDRFAISSSVKLVLRLYTFYFPGWRATVDGQEVEIEVAQPEGFITLWVPAGQHEVLVRFEDTPPRTAGWIVSVVGLAGLVVALGFMRTPHVAEQETRVFCKRRYFDFARSDRTWFLWLGGGLLLFVILKSGVIDPHDSWMRYTSPPGQAWVAQYEQRATFAPIGGGVGEGHIELLGYDLPRQRVRSGDTFSVLLYWHALRPVDMNYQSFVHLARPLHVLWGQEDHLNPGDLPTTRWPLDKYVWDEYEIRILPGTPPGEYVLNVGLYSMAEGYRLQRYDERGQPVGDSLPLASVQVERPRRQPRPAELGLTQEMTVTFPEAGITLVGYVQPYQKVKLPGVWPITLFWRADGDHPAARARDLVLLDPAGNEVWRFSGVPADYPFEVWQAGEVVRDPILFAAATPVSLMTGKYRFGVVVRGDTPLYPEPRNQVFEKNLVSQLGVFVPLGEVKFRVKENE